MNEDLAQIEFYFPEGKFSDRESVVDAIVDNIEDNNSLDYCGFLSKGDLKEGLLNQIGKGSLDGYEPITPKERSATEQTISETIATCNEKLSVPTKNFVFVHPYFPGEDAGVFEGVMGVATYSCVFHLFIDLRNFSEQSLINTTAHELNHTIYYYRHHDDFDNQNLLDSILMEGLAENFKEAFFTPESTPWAGALEKEEAFEILEDSMDLLSSTDEEEIRSFIFGKGESQKRWMGYSVGYWLVKRFIAENPDLSWDEMMKLDRKRFLEAIEYRQ